MTSRIKSIRTKRSDPRALARFVEELSWLLSSHEDLDFRALRKMVEEISSKRDVRPRAINKLEPKNRNISFLVGVLPGLFDNEHFFSTNEEIAEFAAAALHVRIPRWQKKSKFELIGHIVCNTARLSDKRLDLLVGALEQIVGDEKQTREIFAQKRARGSSWNEVIQQLYQKM